MHIKRLRTAMTKPTAALVTGMVVVMLPRNGCLQHPDDTHYDIGNRSRAVDVVTTQ